MKHLLACLEDADCETEGLLHAEQTTPSAQEIQSRLCSNWYRNTCCHQKRITANSVGYLLSKALLVNSWPATG